MAHGTRRSSGDSLGELRAKAALFDELVERLAEAEDELEQVRAASPATGIDPAWRAIANDLAGALRPYTMFREQRVEEGRIIIETRVPGGTLTAARAALDLLGSQVATESRRAVGMTPTATSTPPAEPRSKAA
jgi:hypothetical protein